MGLTARPSAIVMKCRCGPVVNPLMPTYAMIWPAETVCPTETIG